MIYTPIIWILPIYRDRNTYNRDGETEIGIMIHSLLQKAENHCKPVGYRDCTAAKVFVKFFDEIWVEVFN